jgi:Gp157 protein
MPHTAQPARQNQSLRAHIETVDAIAGAIEQLDDETLNPAERDEISAELIAAIAGTRAKVDRTCAVLAMFEHLEAAAKTERDRLDRRAAYYARQHERLEKYLLAVLETSKLDRIDGETSSLQRKLNPPAVEIEPGATFASEFLRYKPAPPAEPDKNLIKRALQARREVPGARLAQAARLVRS